jgi:hypothetical protein
MKNFAERQAAFVPNVRLYIGVIACIGFLFNVLLAARCAKKVEQALIDALNTIIAREHMGWCNALINKDRQGMLQTAAWINCCLEIAEKLNLEAIRPLGWHNDNDELEWTKER